MIAKAYSFSHPVDVELDHYTSEQELDRQDKENSQDPEDHIPEHSEDKGDV